MFTPTYHRGRAVEARRPVLGDGPAVVAIRVGRTPNRLLAVVRPTSGGVGGAGPVVFAGGVGSASSDQEGASGV